MVVRIWLIVLALLAGAYAAAATETAPPLYKQVAGSEETVAVEKRTNVANLALERGVRWTVVVGQNRLKKPYRLNPGECIKINHTHIVPAELKDGLVINLPELNLYYVKNGVYQRRYALAVGKPSWPTPTGTYKIFEKRKNPTWNVPPSIQEEMEESGQEVVEKVPPGPKNPLGKFYMGTTAAGVGIHATNRPWSVGYFVSHGCIRMLPQEIEQLFPQIPVGTPVKIIYRPIKIAVTPEGKVYLEANLNIYQWELNSLDYVKSMAEYYQITERIDWSKVPNILRRRDGIAHDITKAPEVPIPAGTSIPPTSTQVGLSPLQGKSAKLE
ncbi:MAG: L,D-transpeptidase family protein [Desulfobaccales bacterium]